MGIGCTEETYRWLSVHGGGSGRDGGDASAKAPRYHLVHSSGRTLSAGANGAFRALRILCVAGQGLLTVKDEVCFVFNQSHRNREKRLSAVRCSGRR